MKRVVGALLPLLLWACEPAALPAPSIVSVEPEQIPAGFPVALSVKLNAVMPLSVDYQTQAVDPAQLAVAVHVGGQVVDIPFVDQDGLLVVPVPENLALGHYDLQVTLADGRTVVRERAFFVVPPSTLNSPGSDGGTSEDGGSSTTNGRDGILGFWISSIEDQARNVPFKITIHALGRDAKTFKGAIILRSSKGQVTTHRQGSFVEGERVEEISVSEAGSNIYLMVMDTQGHIGLSLPFDVR